MQAVSTAYSTTIGGTDYTVQNACTVLLPIIRTNLIANPDFAYGTQGWLLAAGTPTLTRSVAQQHVGPTSGLITWTTGGTRTQGFFTTVAGDYTSIAGQAYTASCWVYVPTGNPAVVVFADDPILGTVYGTASTLTNTWQQLSITATSLYPVDGLSVGLLNNAAATAGQTCYMTDWLLELGSTVGSNFTGDNPADINLCYNPSFEQTIIPGDDWTAAGCKLFQDTAWSADGHTSGKLTPNSASTTSKITLGLGSGSASGQFENSMYAGQTYTVSATCNVPVALSGSLNSAACQIVVGWKVAGTSTVGSATGPTTGGTSRLSVTVAIPSNAIAVWIELWNGATNSAANVVRWDNVCIRNVNLPGDLTYIGPRSVMSDRRWLGTPGNSPSVLNVDPYPDKSLTVESIKVIRSMVTDMPDGTRLVNGYPAATATVTLSGYVDQSDETKTVAWLCNSYDPTSPMWMQTADGALVQTKHGIRPDGAPLELLPTFTGTVDECLVDGETGQVTLTCIDLRNEMRPTIVLPAVAYGTLSPGNLAFQFYSPGMTGGWVLNNLLRQNGFYTTPPNRDECLFYASMYGSCWPETYGPRNPVLQSQSALVTAGTAIYDTELFADPPSYGTIGQPSDFMALCMPGVFNDQVVKAPYCGFGVPLQGSNTFAVATFGGVWEGVGYGLFFEGWLWADNTLDHPSSLALHGNSTAANGWAYFKWDWALGASTAAMTFVCNRAAGQTSSGTLATMTTGAWHHVKALAVATSSTNVAVTVQIDNTKTTTNVTCNAITTEQLGSGTEFHWGGWAEGIQITAETEWVLAPVFIPNAYLDPSFNALVATQDTTGQDPWQVIQQLCEAEGAVGGLDEVGTFRFTNRRNLLSKGSSRTVTSATSLKTLSIDTQKSTCATHVTANIAAVTTTAADLWSAQDVIRVGAGQATTLLVTVAGGTALEPPALDQGENSGPHSPGVTDWRACRAPNGAAGVVSGITVFAYSVTPTQLSIVIYNYNPFDVYMVSALSLLDVPGGTPWVHVGGVLAAAGTATACDSQWPPNDGDFTFGAASGVRGDITLPLPDNVWRQDTTVGQLFTDDVLDDLYKPRPLLSNFNVVMDAATQIADVVTVLDPDGTKLADPVVISRIELSDSAGEWGTSITARSVAPPGGWIMGLPGRSEMGVTTYV